jgi:osmotically inducible protein OsmC
MVTFERTAEMNWNGDVVRGSGVVNAGSGSFTVPASYPTLRGEAPGTTTPEELLAASHASCYAIALRSVIARSSGTASGIVVTATLTAEKGQGVIRVTRSHLSALVIGSGGLDDQQLADCAVAAKDECTISNVLRGNVSITSEVKRQQIDGDQS